MKKRRSQITNAVSALSEASPRSEFPRIHLIRTRWTVEDPETGATTNKPRRRGRIVGDLEVLQRVTSESKARFCLVIPLVLYSPSFRPINNGRGDYECTMISSLQTYKNDE